MGNLAWASGSPKIIKGQASNVKTSRVQIELDSVLEDIINNDATKHLNYFNCKSSYDDLDPTTFKVFMSQTKIDYGLIYIVCICAVFAVSMTKQANLAIFVHVQLCIHFLKGRVPFAMHMHGMFNFKP